MIPYGRQDVNEADVKAVLEVLQSDWLTQGPVIPQFESAIADYCGAGYAVAMSNATAALHISCLALELKKGDVLWTSPNTYVASANCALYCNAEVDFVDIDSATYNMSVDALRMKLEIASEKGQLPKIVVVVHFAGQSCEMKAIKKLSEQYAFKIIEDASHAIGGKYLSEPIGVGLYSDITIFSFHPVKIMTTGEGGMALTNDKKLAFKLRLLHSHGVTRDPNLIRNTSPGDWYYEQVDLGFNYRMTDIQAALGKSQLTRLDEFVDKRTAIAERYSHLLRDLPLTLPRQHPDSKSSYHLYPVQIKKEETKLSRKQVFDALRKAGIGVNVHYIPVHTQPYYQDKGFKVGDFPEAEEYYANTLSLPIYSALNKGLQSSVIGTLKRIFK